MQSCADVNCPKHGTLKVRGSIIEGVVVSDKPKNTVIVQREYLTYIPKYERYERRKTKINAHKPPCMEVKTGDRVRIGECRKVSKTKSFVVLEKLK
ncbi:MAG: 30S ribosomal protein S17 [archaeon]